MHGLAHPSSASALQEAVDRMEAVKRQDVERSTKAVPYNVAQTVMTPTAVRSSMPPPLPRLFIE